MVLLKDLCLLIEITERVMNNIEKQEKHPISEYDMEVLKQVIPAVKPQIFDWRNHGNMRVIKASDANKNYAHV